MFVQYCFYKQFEDNASFLKKVTLSHTLNKKTASEMPTATCLLMLLKICLPTHDQLLVGQFIMAFNIFSFVYIESRPAIQNFFNYVWKTTRVFQTEPFGMVQDNLLFD